MLKRIIALTVLLLFSFQASAFAAETIGSIVFTDAMYGAGVGAILGTAFYYSDPPEDNKGETFMKRLSTGVIVGTLGGMIFGVFEAQSAMVMKAGKVEYNMPKVNVEQRGKETVYSANLLEVKF